MELRPSTGFLLPTQATVARHSTAALLIGPLQEASPLAAAESGANPSWAAAAVALAVGAGFSASRASGSGKPQRLPRGRRTARAAETVVVPKIDRDTTKAFRKNFQRSEQYYKFGKTQMDEAMSQLRAVSGSDLVSQIRANSNRLTIGDVTFVLAESYGMCWGVERAIAMAFEARNFFPDKTIWLTNEIVHNPMVNERLKSEKGIQILEEKPDGNKDFSPVGDGDVVVLPAFGAVVDDMAYLQQKGVQIVDTTCPWVSKVWTSVEKSKAKGCTSIIHGKYSHEETIATKSFAKKYIIVKDLNEAEYLARYMLGDGNKAELMAKFSRAMSEGFDPDEDLVKVGVANQTTMLKGETELIGRLFERIMIRKYGPQEINDHFVSFNTICDATQDRQDAMYKMFDASYVPPQSKLYAELEGEQVGVELLSEKEKSKMSSKSKEDASRGTTAAVVDEVAPQKVDMVLAVGGFNSSNTTHLIEIGLEEGVPSYHVDTSLRLGGLGDGIGNQIQHKPLSTSPQDAMAENNLEVQENFLPNGPVVIGITSGASTPDDTVGEVLQKILGIKQALG